MAKLHLKIVTPERIIFDQEVEEVNVTTSQGEIGILPYHTNLMAKIIPGEIRIKGSGKEEILASGGGLLQITNNELKIITDSAENLADLDEKVIEEARIRAQEAMEQRVSDEEYALAAAALEKALAQLRVKRKHLHH